MIPVKKILHKLNGLHFAKEYCCLTKESITHPLHVYIVSFNRIIKDITNGHLFVGYCPLVFAIVSNPGHELTANIHLIFSERVLPPNASFSKKDAIASLDLQLVKKQVAGNRLIFYYEGIRGSHRFISAFHQFINSMYNQLYKKRPGNVFLPANLYKQVQIAYAVPRIISLITVKQNGLFNLFPTDLHGQVDETYYIISLRTGGLACAQVEAAGKVLIAQVPFHHHETVYQLGKNHMQPLKHISDFPFSASLSQNMGWPLADNFLAYHELELTGSFLHGIHKILLFKILYQYHPKKETATLAHIHNCYATWRHKRKLPGNYLAY
jgi:hypothetical protein